MSQEAVNKYRKYFKKHTTEELWKQYKSRVKSGTPTDIVASKEVTQVLKTLKTYEYYVKQLEKEFKQQIKEQKQKLKEAVQQVKKEKAKNVRLERKIAKLEAQKKGSKSETSTKVAKSKQNAKIEKLVAAVKKNVDKRFESAKAGQRGEDLGRGVGKKTSASSDTYGNLLDLLDTEKSLVFTEAQKKALMASSAFKNAFITKFSGKLSDEEMAELWEQNFGVTSASLKPAAGDYNISWKYTPKKKKKG